MTAPDIAAMRAAAEAARPIPVRWVIRNKLYVERGGFNMATASAPAIAAHIVASQPANVLALIARLEEAEAEIRVGRQNCGCDGALDFGCINCWSSQELRVKLEAAEAEITRLRSSISLLPMDRGELAARNDQQAALLRQAEEALEKAKAQFLFYSEQHLAKGTEDGLRKARVNTDMAREMETVAAAIRSTPA